MIIEKVAYDKSTTVACGQEHYRTSSKPKSSFAEAIASKDVYPRLFVRMQHSYSKFKYVHQ